MCSQRLHALGIKLMTAVRFLTMQINDYTHPPQLGSSCVSLHCIQFTYTSTSLQKHQAEMACADSERKYVYMVYRYGPETLCWTPHLKLQSIRLAKETRISVSSSVITLSLGSVLSGSRLMPIQRPAMRKYMIKSCALLFI